MNSNLKLLFFPIFLFGCGDENNDVQKNQVENKNAESEIFSENLTNSVPSRERVSVAPVSTLFKGSFASDIENLAKRPKKEFIENYSKFEINNSEFDDAVSPFAYLLKALMRKCELGGKIDSWAIEPIEYYYHIYKNVQDLDNNPKNNLIKTRFASAVLGYEIPPGHESTIVKGLNAPIKCFEPYIKK